MSKSSHRVALQSRTLSLKTSEILKTVQPPNANPNILSHSEAKCADDYDKFQEAMQEKRKRMIESKIFKEVPVPMGQCVFLRAVWSQLSMDIDLASVQMAVTNNME